MEQPSSSSDRDVVGTAPTSSCLLKTSYGSESTDHGSSPELWVESKILRRAASRTRAGQRDTMPKRRRCAARPRAESAWESASDPDAGLEGVVIVGHYPFRTVLLVGCAARDSNPEPAD